MHDNPKIATCKTENTSIIDYCNGHKSQLILGHSSTYDIIERDEESLGRVRFSRSVKLKFDETPIKIPIVC